MLTIVIYPQALIYIKQVFILDNDTSSQELKIRQNYIKINEIVLFILKVKSFAQCFLLYFEEKTCKPTYNAKQKKEEENQKQGWIIKKENMKQP